LQHADPKQGDIDMSLCKLAISSLTAILTLAAGTASADELFKATLSGGQEVPPVATDTAGMAFFRLDGAGTSLEFQLQVTEGVDVTQSHIHCAPAGENGPIVVFLAGLHAAGLDVDGKWIDNATINDSAIVNTACGATVAELAESMRSGNTYVNVHSLAFPAGEARGQIASAR
jgi:CHRD domain